VLHVRYPTCTASLCFCIEIQHGAERRGRRADRNATCGRGGGHQRAYRFSARNGLRASGLRDGVAGFHPAGNTTSGVRFWNESPGDGRACRQTLIELTLIAISAPGLDEQCAMSPPVPRRSSATPPQMKRVTSLLQPRRGHRPQQTLLCALCAPLCELCVEARWSRHHRRLTFSTSRAANTPALAPRKT